MKSSRPLLNISVGVNTFVAEDEAPLDLLKISPVVERQQAKRIREVKAKRNGPAVLAALENLKSEAKTSKNLMPAIRQAVREYATLGEMCAALKAVFGQYHDPGHF